MDKLENYLQKLEQMIAIRTVSVLNDKDFTQFDIFQKKLESLFPNVFQNFKFERFSGAILLSLIVDNDKEPILFMSHHDVVEENGIWKVPPFNPTREDNRLYGRGTLDTKGYLFVILQAFEELLESGYQFQRSIYIESSFNEETCQTGAKEVADTLKERGVHFAMVIDEGGFVVDNPFGESKQKVALVALCEKSCIEIKFSLTGHGGHASMPEEKEPLIVLSKFMIEAKKKNKFISYLDDNEVEMLRAVAPSLKGIKSFLFKRAKCFRGLITKLFKKLSPTTKAMISSTICFTRIEGSNGNNVIPDCPYVVANIRASKKETNTGCINKILKIADKYHLEHEILDGGYESKVSDFHSPEFAFFKDAIKEFYPDAITAPYTATGASDAKCFDIVCDNIFRFAPFYVDNEQLNTIHGVNENVYVDNLLTGVNFIKRIVEEY